MSGRDIVIIGASAGGFKPLQSLLAALPENLPATVFAVWHRSAVGSLVPPSRLLPNAALPVHWAADGDRFQRGHAYLAAPGHHLLVERGRVRLEQGPREIWSRPAVDALFRSAAFAYGRRVVGILLSGMLHDGTAGLWQIKKRGGVAIVQDPFEAQHADMVRNALKSVPIDHCLPVRDVARTVAELATAAPSPPPLIGPQSASVLIVEDERVVALNLEKRLHELGYTVAGSTGSGEGAIELAEQTQADVVLMDIHLSGSLDGVETARRLWERFQIPVVYVTAYADAATLEEVKTTEPYGYVVKPFRPDDIHVALQLALERRDRETREE